MSVYPETPLQKLAALTLDLFGGEGLVRAAMHFRWSFRSYPRAVHCARIRLVDARLRRPRTPDMAARIGPMMNYSTDTFPCSA